MKYKMDWLDAQKRLTALWHREVIDRPCIAVTAPSGKKVEPPAAPKTPFQKWMDTEWVLGDLSAHLENTWWGGEAIPSYLLMGGWVLCLGGKPRFDLQTIWFDTFAVDFSKPSLFNYKQENVWVEAHSNLYQAVVRFAGKDDFLVGHPCILPANDLLSMLMGTEIFLLNLIDHRAWMRDAILAGASEQLRVSEQLRAMVRHKHDFWYGNAGWMPFWAPEPFITSQSDVSCMLSTEMFKDFILPELVMYGDVFGALWYHLDGGDARHHLTQLLSLPYLRVIQYTPAPNEPPNGPAHLELYRAIQQAGKIVHIEVPHWYVEPLVKELDPAYLMLQTHCGDVAQGEILLESSKNWF